MKIQKLIRSMTNSAYFVCLAHFLEHILKPLITKSFQQEKFNFNNSVLALKDHVSYFPLAVVINSPQIETTSEYFAKNK